MDKNILKLQDIGEQKIVESLEESQEEIQNIESKKIFPPIKEKWKPKHNILFTTLRETINGNLVTSKKIGQYLPYNYSTEVRKSTVSTEIRKLHDSGYIHKLKSCPVCGTTFKSIPEQCSNPECEFTLLFPDVQSSSENRNHKPPHFGVQLTPKALDEMDTHYFSLKEYVFEYESYRGTSICHRIQRYIKSLTSFSWSIIKDRESLHRLVIEGISTILSDIKILKELGTRFNQEFEISYLEKITQKVAKNLRFEQWRRLSETLEMLDTMISSLIPEA